MPEGPEAEHARARIERFLAGRTIDAARALDGLVVRTPDDAAMKPADFARLLEGAKVRGAIRRGKRVVILFDEGRALGLTLGMTGKPVLVETPKGEVALPPHTRWAISSGPRTLALVDARRLSRATAGERTAVEAFLGFPELGPEPEDVRTPAALAARFQKVRGPIQGALMDQARIAGLGNIHAGESLHLARIRPTRSTASLSPAEWAALLRGIRAALRRAVIPPESELTYATEGGRHAFLVYGREGERCRRCRTTIVRAKAQGRSWFYCPTCQPARRTG